jgi:uncharacterized protein YndB with AHSA1/START domain
MTERSVQYASFTIERTYEFTPAEVFGAFAEAEAKNRWLLAPDEVSADDASFDFRVGGRDHFTGKMPDSPTHRYDALYYDIVPDQRIIYSYEMYLDDARISVSVATIELAPTGAGTRLTFTEQGAFLDGHDTPEQREHGTGEVLDDFGRALREMKAADGTTGS